MEVGEPGGSFSMRAMFRQVLLRRRYRFRCRYVSHMDCPTFGVDIWGHSVGIRLMVLIYIMTFPRDLA